MSKVTGSIVTSEHLRRRSEEAHALSKADAAAGLTLLSLARQVVANEFLSLANAVDRHNAAKEITDAQELA